ncbi:hypothetical protein AB0C34_13120 [Nocardia sp. NPDC049220]|uniref:hypothetical protein n=1 Tax=Nocardia sp. NPDC049220 TaxID=3155273 RepID=UPI0033ED5A47
MAHRTARPAGDPGTAPLAPIAITLGLLLLVVAGTQLNRLPGWAGDYGAVLVYLAFILYLLIAGSLLWWGVDTVIRFNRTRH